MNEDATTTEITLTVMGGWLKNPELPNRDPPEQSSIRGRSILST